LSRDKGRNDNFFNTESILKTVFTCKVEIINTFLTEEKDAGYYSTVWDGKNEVGNLVPSGVYFYQIKSGSFVQTKKMLLIK
jgi:flagellar hook assembly protein FlgD